MTNEQPLVIWHNPSTLTTTQVAPQLNIPIISDIGNIINAIMMIVVLMVIMPIMGSMSQGFGFSGDED